MYTRRAALATFNSIRPLLKVCRIRTPDFPYSVNALCLIRNFKSATEISDVYNSVDKNFAENHLDYSNPNRNDVNYGSNLSRVEQNQNPSRVYRQSPDPQFGNYADSSKASGHSVVNHIDYNRGNQTSGIYDRNLEVEQNQNYSGFHGQNVNLNGYAGGGVSGVSAQNHGGNWQWNRSGQFSSGKTEMFQTNYGGNQNGNMEMSQPTGSNTGMYQQNGGGVYHSNSNNNWNYQQNWSENQGNGMHSNVASVDFSQESQPRYKIEDLDQLSNEGKVKEAVELLELLKRDGLQIDQPHYITLIKACGENEALEEAKSVHTHLLESIPNIDVRTSNKILEMYSKCGSMADAFKVFDKMPQRNLTSWDVMIYGLAKNGLGEDSLDLFAEFKKTGLKPDDLIFIGVFKACGVLCDTIEGMLHFESMTKDYGIVASMDHYVSIVDMLGSAGCLDDALEFVENLSIEPNVEIWEILMKFSRIHGNTELGDRCAENVHLLDSSRLNEQSREGLIPLNASDLEKEKIKRKLSGQNLLDVRNKVHEYRAGDRSHPEHEKIYAMLRGLRQQMKEAGYIPDIRHVLHDVDHEAKEEALMAHSERLAAAQGFMTSAARAPLRIIKNLRVCVDCHTAFKIISKIVGRTIVARDAKRFHHFIDGACSCNDFW